MHPFALVWNRHEKRIFGLSLVLGLVLLAWALSQLTWLLLTPVEHPDTMIPAASAPAIHAGTGTRNPGEAVAELHVFGSAEPTIAPTAAPETRLNLRLVGVFATGDSSAIAIIASGNRPEAVYGIGDTVPGGAVIRAVYADRILIERAGALETLKLPEESLGGNAFTPATPGPATSTGDLGSDLQQYRREAMRNPARMAEMMDAQPVEEGGRFVGFRLTPKADLPLFAQLGFQPGDVVTEVNGVPLDRPEAGIRALRQLATAREINVTVLRNGSPQTIQASFGR